MQDSFLSSNCTVSLLFPLIILLPCVCTDYFSKHVLCISPFDAHSQLFLKTPDGKAPSLQGPWHPLGGRTWSSWQPRRTPPWCLARVWWWSVWPRLTPPLLCPGFDRVSGGRGLEGMGEEGGGVCRRGPTVWGGPEVGLGGPTLLQLPPPSLNPAPAGSPVTFTRTKFTL